MGAGGGRAKCLGKLQWPALNPFAFDSQMMFRRNHASHWLKFSLNSRSVLSTVKKHANGDGDADNDDGGDGDDDSGSSFQTIC